MNWLALIVALALPQLAGAIGSLATFKNIPTWYAALARPALSPPNWVFGPVWTILFVLMGIASYLVWMRGWERGDVRLALALFAIQLALNTLWSVIFFGLHSPGAALVEIMFLWLAILATAVAFWRISPVAGALMLPYLAWMSFAGYLNYAIWTLN